MEAKDKWRDLVKLLCYLETLSMRENKIWRMLLRRSFFASCRINTCWCRETNASECETLREKLPYYWGWSHDIKHADNLHINRKFMMYISGTWSKTCNWISNSVVTEKERMPHEIQTHTLYNLVDLYLRWCTLPIIINVAVLRQLL